MSEPSFEEASIVPLVRVGDNRYHPDGGIPMAEPIIAQKGPYEVILEAGKVYKWCACGRSANQPFCDGSHKDTEFRPVVFEANESGTVFLCGCKHTGDRPWCDGTHETL